MTWREPHLMQRLKAPLPSHNQTKMLLLMNAFDGVSATLSKEARALLASIFSWDYMGAAEYEFGVVPNTLHELAKSKLVATTFVVPGDTVERSYRPLVRGKRPKLEPLADATIYLLSREEHITPATEAFRQMAAGKVYTKGGHRIGSTLDPVHDWDRQLVGWLELDNGWFAFVDRATWERTAKLFGVET